MYIWELTFIIRLTCLWSKLLSQVSHSCCGVPGQDVDQGGGREDAGGAEQERLWVRRVDPEQHQDRRVRHPPHPLENGSDLHGQQHCYPELDAKNGGSVQSDAEKVVKMINLQTMTAVSGKPTSTCSPTRGWMSLSSRRRRATSTTWSASTSSTRTPVLK